MTNARSPMHDGADVRISGPVEWAQIGVMDLP
jgi:hypothetical protein